MFQNTLFQSSFFALAILFMLHTIFAQMHAQQQYFNTQEQPPTHYTRRNKNIYQQTPFESPPQDASLYNRQSNSKMAYQQPVYNAYNRQKANQLNQGSRRNEHVRHQVAHIEHSQHKCYEWVPSDVLDKYPETRKMEDDQLKILARIETCCEGYRPMRWRTDLICRPICENCKNGICTKPGECQCHEGFVKNDNGDCIFTCPLGCLNGKCYLDGTCKCDPGFKLDRTRQYCQPICSSGCGENIRHNCTEPEVCGCAKGYQLKDDGCQPVCQPDCGIGGICQDGNICECKQGYELKDGVCQSDCYQECKNGICYSRNRCVCNPGFTYHERTTFCVPV